MSDSTLILSFTLASDIITLSIFGGSAVVAMTVVVIDEVAVVVSVL